jgi:NADPH-dependent curcumin reductase CurA
MRAAEQKAHELEGSRIQRWVLQSKPKGPVGPHNFKMEQVELPKLDEGNIFVRPSFISVDPYLRGWAIADLSEGDPMTSGMVGTVAQSKHAQFREGDKVFCYANWATVAQADPAQRQAQVIKLPDEKNIPPSAYLGCLGMPGATAYFGLKNVGPLKKDDLVLVSGASGTVGSMVGQLAKLWGAKRIIGSDMDARKSQLAVDKFAYDACLDTNQHDTLEKVRAELKRINPEGFDLYWEGTGGPVTWAFYEHPRKFARVVLCGQISEYEKDEEGKPPLIPNPFKSCIFTSVKIQGFVVWDYYDRWSEFLSEVTPLVRDGKIRFEETVMHGFDKLPEALAGLFKGVNIGKMVVKVE